MVASNVLNSPFNRAINFYFLFIKPLSARGSSVWMKNPARNIEMENRYIHKLKEISR